MGRAQRAATQEADATTLPEPDADSNGPEDSPIARRAFERYEAQGRAHGHHLEDWLEAGRELQQDASRSSTAVDLTNAD